MSETLIHNARIRTMDPTAPLAEWLLMRGGKIAALGSGTPPPPPRTGSTRVGGWCLSSDWAVSTLSPFEIIETAITRQKRRDDDPQPPFFADQALTVEDCVQGYTVNAARACWRDAFTGMLRVGYSADVIVLDRDVFAVPVRDISATRVLLTLSKGREVWRDLA